ncbi:uncharacterized protein LOC134006548 [Scomber scombrus]|uniref:uncharacterized protein LOC134006548 n=1 Tax=Scomber scombrus TaxID=13677 RepID=UPI002DDAE92B|nr:uncharacterized protein LOC134006548 [Scomber scombrus]
MGSSKTSVRKKKEAEERGQIEEQIASEQLELQGLMSCLSDLKSELAQVEEAYKDLQMQINIQDAKENKTDASEKLSAAKSHTKKGRERRKAVTSAEKLQDASKTGNQTSLKDDPAHKSTNESTQTSTKEQTKQKAGTEKSAKSVKAARGSQRKAEQQESNSQESVQAVRGRRPPAGPSKTTDPQLKKQSKVKTGERQSTSQQASSQSRKKAAVAADDAGRETQNTSLRRSKRIASRK